MVSRTKQPHEGDVQDFGRIGREADMVRTAAKEAGELLAATEVHPREAMINAARRSRIIRTAGARQMLPEPAYNAIYLR